MIKVNITKYRTNQNLRPPEKMQWEEHSIIYIIFLPTTHSFVSKRINNGGYSVKVCDLRYNQGQEGPSKIEGLLPKLKETEESWQLRETCASTLDLFAVKNTTGITIKTWHLRIKWQ